MGAKQSKRSIDISGKEAESAGEVAASIAGGEGRLEPLADADALKPQLNGDAHIHDTEEKQKDVDSGTPENEKDATTEKETKQQEEDKEGAPLTNGESEPKVENGESTPTPEDGKKPKKEKVKKKWSLRSISFSRKDKPKQEKKSKDEEPKINGEPEKVPEETADVASEEPVVTETAEEAKTPTEIKEDKTPETPVTEPITNGSSTPDSTKVETPVVEEPAAPSPVIGRPESKTEVEPEQLPVNGLSIEEPTEETTEVVKNEDSKEEPIAETTETVPDIPVKKEVCVEQMPLIDSTPPPLPANPPPSSVASFAATTMAPELSDASLANTADNATLPPPSPPTDTFVKDEVNESASKPEGNLIEVQTVRNKLSSPINKVSEVTSLPVPENRVEYAIKETVILTTVPIEYNKLTVHNVEAENDTIEITLVEKAKVSAGPEMYSSPSEISEAAISSPSKLIKESLIDTEEVSTKLQGEMKTPPLGLIEESVIEKELLSKEKPLEHNELELPSPKAELIEGREIEKAEVANTSVTESTIKKKLEDSELDMPAPLSLVFVETADADRKNTVENLPDPPPPLNDDSVHILVTNSVSEKSDLTPNITKVSDNSDNIRNTKETDNKREEYENDTENLDKNSIKKSTDSLLDGNLSEIIECNGSSEIEPAEIVLQNSAKEPAELAPTANSKDIANAESDRTVTSPDEWRMPASPLENSAAGDNDESLPLPLPPSELCEPDGSPDLSSDLSPDHAPPQEPLSDKLADLIPEVPEVPALKTETDATSVDAGVAN